ncbi:hypothetical protein [Streptomyces sp. NPDC048419]
MSAVLALLPSPVFLDPLAPDRGLGQGAAVSGVVVVSAAAAAFKVVGE